MYDAEDIASSIPPPDKLKGGKMPDGDEAAGETEADEDKAVRVSQMQGFMDALGIKGGDAEAACDAIEQYLDTVGYRR